MDGLAIARENKWLLLAAMLACALLGLAAALANPRPYEAVTRLMIDPRGMQVVDKDITPRVNAIDQNLAIVESETKVMVSDIVLKGVIESLRLMDDPDYNGTRTGAFAFIGNAVREARAMARRLIFGAEPDGKTDLSLSILNDLKRVVYARREPQSFVVDLYARALSPEKAKLLADAVTAEYLKARFSVQSEATRRASEKLNALLDQQRRRLEAAEGRVEKYRSSNDIIGIAGRLVNEQQRTEISSLLVVAQGETARASARLEQLTRLKESRSVADSTSEALSSPTLINLRNQHSALRRRESALQPSMLPSHPVYKQVQRELQGTERLISEELARLAQGARLDLERAKANEAAIQQSLGQQKSLALNVNAKQVELRELEREVEASRSVYASYLGRARELAEQRQVDSSLVVVLSPAVIPLRPSGLSPAILLLGASMFGLGLGFGAVALREQLDPLLRRARHVRHISGKPEVEVISGFAAVPRVEGKAEARNGGLPLIVVGDPQAEVSQTIAGLRDQLKSETAGSYPAVILLTSVDDRPARSIIAANLAVAWGQDGDRVLLIDGDMDKRRITHAFDLAGSPGLLDVVGRTADASAAIQIPDLGISVLAIGRRRLRGTTLGSEEISAAISRFANDFDVIVIDATTLRSASLLAAWSPTVDLMAVLTELNVTEKSALESGIQSLRSYRPKKWVTVAVQRD